MNKRECQQRFLEAFEASDKSAEAVRVLLGAAFQCGWQAAVTRKSGCPMAEPTCPMEKHGEAAAQPEGYCDRGSTAPHQRNEECINWTPEIEHDDH